MPKAIARDGVGIHYRVVGEQGPWVVFIQGLSLSGRFWFDAPEQIAGAFGARAIVLDNRGIGRSDRVNRPFSMRTLAADVAAVLDHAGCDKATMVGISMGGNDRATRGPRAPRAHRGAGAARDDAGPTSW